MSTTISLELNEIPRAVVKGQVPIQALDDVQTRVQSNVASTSGVEIENKGATAIIITVITGVTTISSLLAGLVTIALPVMAKDLDIPQALLIWFVFSSDFSKE
jgi:hypothetical protein